MPSEFAADYDPFPESAPWLQMRDETDLAHAAFCVYRDTGARRSLRQAARDHYGLEDLPERSGPTAAKLSQISQWSQIYDWSRRAGAYDLHLDRLARIEHAEEIREMAKRHVAVSQVMIARGTEKLRAMPAVELTAKEAAALIDLGVKIERLTRGQATEITADDDAVIDVTEGQLEAVLASDPAAALAARDVALALSARAASLQEDPETAEPEQPEP